MPPQPEHRSARRTLRSVVLSRFVDLAATRLDRLEWSDAQAFGRILGRLAWRLSRRDRARAVDHLALAFPDLDPNSRRRLAHASFEHLGVMLAELLFLSRRGRDEIERRVEIEGWEEIEATRATRRPLLVVSGHCGSWELIHAVFNARGVGMSVVARGLDDLRLQETLIALRGSFGTTTVVRGAPDSARELLRALRSKGALAMLIDQDTAVEGVWVDFFGRPAWTPAGAAELAARFRARVHPVFSERLPDGRHRVRVLPALELPPDTREATQAMTAEIERQVRRVPAQWVWMHRRWRRQPPATT